MPSLKLSKLIRRDADRLSLKQRMSGLKAAAGRVMRRRRTDQPSPETLPAATSVETSRTAFHRADHGLHHARPEPAKPFNRDGAESGGERSEETEMGRHETFTKGTRLADATDGLSRRIMVAGSLAVVSPLPALAAPAVLAAARPHPDQAVFDAEAAMLHAEQVFAAARDADAIASNLASAELGVCPATILMSKSEAGAIVSPFAPRDVWRCRSFHWAKVNEDDEWCSERAWTPAGLRMAIQYAVPIFGKGGTTPNRIRLYRELLPLAELYDARRTEIRQRHRVDELTAVYRDTGNAMSAARDALDKMRATTPEGLAVLARHLASYEHGRIEAGWIGLLESAALVGGVGSGSTGERRVRTTFM